MINNEGNDDSKDVKEMVDEEEDEELEADEVCPVFFLIPAKNLIYT